MVNIWQYIYEEGIRIICTTGEVFEGDIITVDDGNEEEVVTEDSVVIETYSGMTIGLKQSEIVKIERI